MYRVSYKNGIVFFTKLDDLFAFVILHDPEIFHGGAYIKISMEDSVL